MFINWEMHISCAEMEHREELIQGAETQALLAEAYSPFMKGRDQLHTKFLPVLTELPVARYISC